MPFQEDGNWVSVSASCNSCRPITLSLSLHYKASSNDAKTKTAFFLSTIIKQVDINTDNTPYLMGLKAISSRTSVNSFSNPPNRSCKVFISCFETEICCCIFKKSAATSNPFSTTPSSLWLFSVDARNFSSFSWLLAILEEDVGSVGRPSAVIGVKFDTIDGKQVVQDERRKRGGREEGERGEKDKSLCHTHGEAKTKKLGSLNEEKRRYRY